MMSLISVWQPVKKKENFEFKSVKLCKKLTLYSHPARVCVCGGGRYTTLEKPGFILKQKKKKTKQNKKTN